MPIDTRPRKTSRRLIAGGDPTTFVGFKIAPEDLAALDAEAKRRNLSRAAMVRAAVTEILQEEVAAAS